MSTQTLLKTKQHEDPGFEIIKEVMGGSSGAVSKLLNPYGGAGGSTSNFNNPNLAALASLMAAGGGSAAGSGGLGPAALMNPNLLLPKCKLLTRILLHFVCSEKVDC